MHQHFKRGLYEAYAYRADTFSLGSPLPKVSIGKYPL